MADGSNVIGSADIELRAKLDKLKTDLADAEKEVLAKVKGIEQSFQSAMAGSANSATKVKTAFKDAGDSAAKSMAAPATAAAQAATKVAQSGQAAGKGLSDGIAKGAKDASTAVDRQLDAAAARVKAFQAQVAAGELTRSINPLNGAVSFAPKPGALGGGAASRIASAPLASTGAAAGLREVASATRLAGSAAKESALSVSGLSSGFIAGTAATIGFQVAMQALMAVMKNVREAISLAAELEKTSTALGTTTTELQRLQYAALQAGVDSKTLDGSLGRLNAVLGDLQAGTASDELKQVAEALGLTKKQLNELQSPAALLPILADRISELGTVSERTKVADMFGIRDLVPMLSQGAAGMKDFGDEAERTGRILDEDLAKKAEVLNRHLQDNDALIKTSLTKSYLDLAPIIGQLSDAYADLITKLEKVAEVAPAALAALNRGNPRFGGRAPDAFPDVSGSRFEAPDRSFTVDKPAKTLVQPKGSRGRAGAAAPQDDTAQRQEQANAALYAATISALNATLALTPSIEGRAKIEKQIAEAEANLANARINKQIADVQADKGIRDPAKRKAIIADLESAKAAQDKAALDKQALIDQRTSNDLARQVLEKKEQGFDTEGDLLSLQQGLATAAEDQKRIALEMVDLAYRRSKAELESALAMEGISDADKSLLKQKLADLNKLQPSRKAEARATASSQTEGGRAGIAALEKPVLPGSDDFRNQAYGAIGDNVDARKSLAKDDAERTKIEQEGADARKRIDQQVYQERLSMASTFFGNLATLSGSSNKTLAAIGKAAAIAQATIDGVLAVQKALAAYPPPFNFAIAASVGVATAVNVAKIAGFESGGYTGDGGTKQVSGVVHGREFVVNAPATARNRDLLEALNAGQPISQLVAANPSLAPRNRFPSGAAAPSTRGGDRIFSPTVHTQFVPTGNADYDRRTSKQHAADMARQLKTINDQGIG